MHIINNVLPAPAHAHVVCRRHSYRQSTINRTPRTTTRCSTNDKTQHPNDQPKQQYTSTRDFLNSLRATPIDHPTTPPHLDHPTSQPPITTSTPRPIRRALGVDFGTRRTGIAVSALGFAPRPVEVLDSRGAYLVLAQRVVAIAQEQGADGLVVGLPVTRRGNIHSPTTDSQQVWAIVRG